MPNRITTRMSTVLAVLAVLIMCADVQAQLLQRRGRVATGQSTRTGLFKNFGSRFGRQSNTRAYSQSVYSQPAYRQPVFSQPTTVVPSYSQPTPAQPTLIQPTSSQSTYMQPTYAQYGVAPAYGQPMTNQTYMQPIYQTEVAPSYAPAMVEPANYAPAYVEQAPMIGSPQPVQSTIQPEPQIVDSAIAPVQPVPPAPETQTVVPPESTPPVAQPPAISTQPMPQDIAPVEAKTEEADIIDEITEPAGDSTEAAEQPFDQPIDLIEEPAAETTEEPAAETTEEPAAETTEEPTADSSEEDSSEEPVEDPFGDGGN